MFTDKQVITVTEQAADYIRSLSARELADAQEAENAGLRISIKKGGCSGSEYDFSLATEKGKYDEEIVEKGVRIFVDPGAVLKIIGSEMDYETGKFSSGFVFRNPNELGRCGCGKSVQL